MSAGTERLERRLRYRASRDPLLRAVCSSSLQADVAVWLVGGAVRDAALGMRSEDLDLAAGAGAVRLVRALERVWNRRGFRFTKRGVTTWRFDVGGRKLDLVSAERRGIEADLRRRELTVNAIAFDLRRGELFDPLHGIRDLQAGRLRLSRRGIMREDPLRALRAARFLAQLPGFKLEPDARREAAQVAGRLRRASAERIHDELDKLLVSPAPGRGLAAIERLGLLPQVLPELVPLRDCVAGAGRPDVWRHTLEAIDLSAGRARLPAGALLRDLDSRRLLRWSLLLHDISKPETLGSKPDGRPTFHGHEVLGARRADALLERLRVSRADRRRIRRLVRFHLRPGHLADAGAPPRGMRRLVRETGEDLPLLVLHAACDARASGSPDAARRWRRLRRVLGELLRLHDESLQAAPPLLTGRDVMRVLGVAEGPEVGQVLRVVRNAQDEGRIHNRRQALKFVRQLEDV